MSEQTFHFEESLSELEKIVAQLEKGDATLDESIALFEKGIRLSGACRSALEQARGKILSLSEAEQEALTDDQ